LLITIVISYQADIFTNNLYPITVNSIILSNILAVPAKPVNNLFGAMAFEPLTDALQEIETAESCALASYLAVVAARRGLTIQVELSIY
jgi:hypothetical protein